MVLVVIAYQVVFPSNCTFLLVAIVAVPYRHSPMNTSTDSSLPSVRKDEASNPNPDEFIENLGPGKLTALGRVDAARVMVDNLRINGDKVKPG